MTVTSPIEKGISALEGDGIAGALRVALVVSRFNRFVTEQLMEGAREAFHRHGGRPDALDVVWVPGAFEMPLAAQRLAARGYDAVVALGAVIRGDTPHFEYVSHAASTGLSRVSLDSGVPVAFGVLTTDTVEQATERADPQAGNKGGEAMESAIEMANLLKTIG